MFIEGSDQLGHASKSTASGAFVGNFPEPALDHV
jgi:hypothetical protein